MCPGRRHRKQVRSGRLSPRPLRSPRRRSRVHEELGGVRLAAAERHGSVPLGPDQGSPLPRPRLAPGSVVTV
eukprot:1386131-Prorocentrum_lima.AAC.1